MTSFISRLGYTANKNSANMSNNGMKRGLMNVEGGPSGNTVFQNDFSDAISGTAIGNASGPHTMKPSGFGEMKLSRPNSTASVFSRGRDTNRSGSMTSRKTSIASMYGDRRRSSSASRNYRVVPSASVSNREWVRSAAMNSRYDQDNTSRTQTKTLQFRTFEFKPALSNTQPEQQMSNSNDNLAMPPQHLAHEQPPDVNMIQTDVSNRILETQRRRVLLASEFAGQSEHQKSTDLDIRLRVNDIGSTYTFSRSREEKKENPERLNLDRRNLKECPTFDSEEKLKLLNYQYNSITIIDNLHNLPNLIFLDFYNNQIASISNLHHVNTLRVLMLGKNKIRTIEGLEELTKLDVLDLHGNQIERIENISHLKSLRVLNLADNKIKSVKNLAGLDMLTEINLRRNQIEKVYDFDRLPNLQRVFLSVNNIAHFDDIQCIFCMENLSDLSLDGNKIVNEEFYRQRMIVNATNLRHLDLKRATDDERKMALAILHREEEQRRKLVTLRAPFVEEKQDEIPEEQAKNIEEERQDEGHKGRKDMARERESSLRIIEENWNRLTTQKIKRGSDSARSVHGRDPIETISDHAFFETNDTRLDIYGNAELTQQDDQNLDVSTIQALSIQFVDHGTIVERYLPELKKISNLKSLGLRYNNLSNLEQLTILGQLSTIEAITVENNPLCGLKLLWKHFLIMVLPNLQRINGEEVTTAQRNQARKLFGKLPIFSKKAQKNDKKPVTVKMGESNAEAERKYANNVISHAQTIDSKMKAIDDEWDGVLRQLIIETIEDNAKSVWRQYSS